MQPGQPGKAANPPEDFTEGQVGPYQVSNILSRGPGVWLAAGRDASQKKVLLQLSRCRAAGSPEQEGSRADFLRSITAATEHMTQDPEVEVLGHGVDERNDGTAVIYWALPWVPEADKVGRAGDIIRNADQLIAASTGLLERVIDRHKRGRLEPLLAPEFVALRPAGGGKLLGIPVFLPSQWLAEPVQKTRLAPEEQGVQEPRRAGDLWRVGEAIRILGSRAVGKPAGWISYIDRLTDPDPMRRIGSANEALVELESLQGTLAGDQHQLREERDRQLATMNASAATVIDNRVSSGEASLPPEHTEGSEERTLADVPVSALRKQSRAASEQPTMDGSASSLRSKGSDESPTLWVTRDEVAKAAGMQPDPPTEAALPAPSSEDLSPRGPKGTVVGVRLPQDDRMALIGADGKVVGGVNLPTRDQVQNAQVTNEAGGAHRVPSELQNQPVANPGNLPVKAFGPGGTVASPLPPIGAAPLQPQVQEQAPPAVVPQQQLAPPPPVVPHQPAPQAASHPGVAAAQQLPAAHSNASSIEGVKQEVLESLKPKRMRLTIVMLILLAVAAGAVVQLLKPKKTTSLSAISSSEVVGTESQLITAWNDVVLEVVPSSAVVVGEQDGRILGKSPLRLLVPKKGQVAVLVTAPGYEPVRLILPSRGRLTVNLADTAGVRKCPVEVIAPGKALAAVGYPEVKPTKNNYQIPGAVVMRSVEGHGAWLVRCVTYGGQKQHRFVSRRKHKKVELKVSRPELAAILIDSDGIGDSPVARQVKAGFIKVRAETKDGAFSERWVPAFVDTNLGMPRPSKPKKAKVTP